MTMTLFGKKLAAITAFVALTSTGLLLQPADAQVAIQDGLVNVTVQDITIQDVVTVSNNNVNVAVAANIVAQVCGITVPINVLAREIFQGGGYTCEVEDVDNEITTVLTATHLSRR
jgi:hypothetical protein